MSVQRRLSLIKDKSEEKWMETAIKVAFATTDMKHVDQHFGTAKSFAIYAIDMEKSIFIEALEFSDLAMDGNEDKLAEKISALSDCIAVYSQAIGASAINQLKKQNIQPVKVTSGSLINELLTYLQDELKQGPCAWLAQAIASTQKKDLSRFDDMEQQGWQED